MEEFVLKARPRTRFGTRVARRLRGDGLLPANIYGHGRPNLAVTLETKAFRRFFEAGHRVCMIEVDGRNEHGVVKEVQYDTLGLEPVHVDFSRVRRDEVIEMEVAIATVGTPKGVTGGGVLDFPLRELTIAGTAGKLPESFEINIEELKIGDVIRIKDLRPPEGCKLVGDPELMVVGVSAPREEPEEEAAEAEPSAAEPEVIGRRKEEDEDEEEGEKS